MSDPRDPRYPQTCRDCGSAAYDSGFTIKCSNQACRHAEKAPQGPFLTSKVIDAVAGGITKSWPNPAYVQPLLRNPDVPLKTIPDPGSFDELLRFGTKPFVSLADRPPKQPWPGSPGTKRPRRLDRRASLEQRILDQLIDKAPPGTRPQVLCDMAEEAAERMVDAIAQTLNIKVDETPAGVEVVADMPGGRFKTTFWDTMERQYLLDLKTIERHRNRRYDWDL